MNRLELDPDRFLVRLWTPAARRPLTDCRSGYAERFWLPVLGPTSLFTGRLLAELLERKPEVWVTASEFAPLLGVGHAGGVRSPMMRAFERIAMFGHARVVDGVYEFCPLWGRVPVGIRQRWTGLLGALAAHEHVERVPA